MNRKVIIGWATNNKTQEADREKYWEIVIISCVTNKSSSSVLKKTKIGRIR